MNNFDKDLECAVISAILCDNTAMQTVEALFRPHIFYFDAHATIAEVLLSMWKSGEAIDLLTVTNAVKSAGKIDQIGGAYYLVELSNRVASAANIEHHIRILVQHWIKRQAETAAMLVRQKANDPTTDPLSLIAFAEKAFASIGQGFVGGGNVTLHTSAMDVLKMVEAAAAAGLGISGLDTGLKEINRITGGWQNSDLIIIAARPGMGKTAFVVSSGMKIAKSGVPVGLFTLEMPTAQITQRAMSDAANIPVERMRRGALQEYEWQNMGEAVRGMENVPFYIDDTPGITLTQLRAKARQWVNKFGVRLIIIDYLQLMQGEHIKGQSREQEISTISRGLKGIAKELNIPVIALSQLSRAVEVRGGSKRPQLSDLRESGAIEQDADLVGFLYRPEYYQITEDENGASLAGVCEFILAKNRNGKDGFVRIGFKGETTSFYNLDEPQFNTMPPPEFNPGAVVVNRASRMDDEDIPF